MRRLICCFVMISVLAGTLTCSATGTGNGSAGGIARPSVNGRLHVDGAVLTDEFGNAVQLRGVSTHGLTWFPDYVNEKLFLQISEDWGCNMVRLAMYSELYSGKEREESLRLMRLGIDAAVKADMYVLVDWHILNDSDPNENIDSARVFFELITAEYGDCPNLLFEICNEPNGTTSWGEVLLYANEIIPLIRSNAPGSVIVVGTPEYDRSLASALLRPLDYNNIMYVMHFYAASHHESLMDELKAAVDACMPVFISECGICESDGDGDIDFASAVSWFQYLNEHSLSYAVWSLSDKDETSAFFKPGFDPYGRIEDTDLTTAGKWVRDLIRGANPQDIPVPAQYVKKSVFASVSAWMGRSLGGRGYKAVIKWPMIAAAAVIFTLVTLFTGTILHYRGKKKHFTYDDIVSSSSAGGNGGSGSVCTKILLLLSMCSTVIYLTWRVVYSIPTDSGIVAVTCNLGLLAVELLGFAESLVLYRSLIGTREHPLPEIPEGSWPEVDVFIATYNESEELLRRTINGCRHLRYPDTSKVHIWLCDDNRRPLMRTLAEKMGVGYFDRPDNSGAKAGNLNHALSLTSAPYIVTFDADMIPRSDFLLRTIPYFVDAELKSAGDPDGSMRRLGFLQTPQSFYDPDVFQHALYSERRAPNEQDFFYRTIEPSKVSTNSVIYGGSNTVLSRQALEDVGGFYTGSVTEDFATGLLIESAGYVSLAIDEPLASGQTPHTFREHIQQRTRWGRGVIVTARKLGIFRRKGLSLPQKFSYWSSVAYWYSPIKNLIYMLSPLMFALLAVPVFRCNWLELLIFWLPMFLLQDTCLRASSRGAISHKWSGIYETGVMAHLLVPILKEAFGITMSVFKVTDKSVVSMRRVSDVRTMLPFLVLALLSVLGIIRTLFAFEASQAVSILILLFWLIRNLYFLIMSMFLVDGRDSDGEKVKVYSAEPVTVYAEDSNTQTWEGVTTLLTEHSITVFLDGGDALGIGTPVRATVDTGSYRAEFSGCVTNVTVSRNGSVRTQTIEILDTGSFGDEYLQILYDRIPTLPQSLYRDFGILTHLWQNVAHRVARSRR